MRRNKILKLETLIFHLQCKMLFLASCFLFVLTAMAQDVPSEALVVPTATSTTPIIAQGSLVKKGLLLFKISEKVYSLAEIRHMARGIQELDCAIGPLALNEGTDLGKEELGRLSQIKNVWDQVNDLQSNFSGVLEKLRSVAKLEYFLSSREVKIMKGTYGTVYDLAKLNHCSVKFFKEKKIPQAEMKRLIKSELFLRQKIQSAQFGETLAPYSQTLKSLFRNLNKQVQHDNFW